MCLQRSQCKNNLDDKNMIHWVFQSLKIPGGGGKKKESSNQWLKSLGKHSETSYLLLHHKQAMLGFKFVVHDIIA